MIKLLAYREETWMDPKADYRQWDQLARAYGAELVMVPRTQPFEDLNLSGVVVVVEEGTSSLLSDFEHPADCTYVFGRTGMNDLVSGVAHDMVVTIDSPVDISLFGVCAAAQILWDRNRKSGD